MITLAADWGGRRIKLGIVQDGCMVAQRVLPAHADQPLELRLAEVAVQFAELCRKHGFEPGKCSAITFAYPSIIDSENARILDHFGKFGDASKINLRKWAHDSLGLPFEIDNDARMALIGEWRYGAGRGCDNLAMMTLGTGLGASAVIEGRVLRGVHGQAGILGGHLTLRVDGRPCVCGNVGCVESEASTWMLGELARERRDFSESLLSREATIEYAEVFRLAAEGDTCAISLRDHSLRVWSAAAVNLIHAYDPERLVLGGGIMGSGDVIISAIRDWVYRYAHTPWGRVQILPSELGDQAALLAGEWLVRSKINRFCEKT